MIFPNLYLIVALALYIKYVTQMRPRWRPIAASLLWPVVLIVNVVYLFSAKVIVKSIDINRVEKRQDGVYNFFDPQAPSNDACIVARCDIKCLDESPDQVLVVCNGRSVIVLCAGDGFREAWFTVRLLVKFRRQEVLAGMAKLMVGVA